MFDTTRACNSNSRKKDRYTKDELLNLSYKYRIALPKTNMTITELCEFYKTLDWDSLSKKKKEPKKLEKKPVIKDVKDMTSAERREEMKVIKSILEGRKREKEKQKARVAKRREENIKARKKKEEFFKKLDKEIEEGKKQKANREVKMASNCVKRCHPKLRDYQMNVIRFMQRNSRLLVYHKMGTGKTLTAVATSQCYLDRNPTHKVVVITPASLSDNFRKGMMQYKYIKHQNRYRFYSIEKATNLLKKNQLDCSNSMVILDEVHNYRAKITFKKGYLSGGVNIFYGYKCFLNADKLLLLTGTPIYNSPDDLNLYKILLNYDSRFENKDTKKIVEHYSKFPINSLLCKISFHEYEKNDADFPRRVDMFKYIAMNPEYERQYHRILEEIFLEDKSLLKFVFKNYKDTNENQFENLTRRATQNIDNNLDLNKKLHQVIKYVNKIKKLNENLPNSEKWKIVIYSQFKEHGIYLIRDMIDIPKATISGNTKVSDRQEIVNLYNSGKIQCLFITKAGGEGLDLKGTDAIIMMEPTWNEQNNEQVIARAIRYKSHEHRPEDRKKVNVIHLIHTTTNDRTEETKDLVKKFLEQDFKKVPRIPRITESCDYIMSIYQQIKQKVLNYHDLELKKLSIEQNEC